MALCRRHKSVSLKIMRFPFREIINRGKVWRTTETIFQFEIKMMSKTILISYVYVLRDFKEKKKTKLLNLPFD